MVRLKACIDKFFCLRVTNNLQVKRKVTYIYIYIYIYREREREREAKLKFQCTKFHNNGPLWCKNPSLH
jgi:hypothetical protein